MDLYNKQTLMKYKRACCITHENFKHADLSVLALDSDRVALSRSAVVSLLNIINFNQLPLDS